MPNPDRMSPATAAELREARVKIARQTELIEQLRRGHNAEVARNQLAERNMKKVNLSRAGTLTIISSSLKREKMITLADMVDSIFVNVEDPTPSKSQKYDHKHLNELLESDEPIIPESLFATFDEESEE